MEEVYLLLGASSDLAKEFILEIDKSSSCTKPIIYGTYYSDKDSLVELKKSLLNVDFRVVQCDLSKDQDIESLISFIGECGVIPNKVIHFAASKFQYMRVKDFDWNKTKNELDVQVGSLAKICKWLLPILKKNKFGRIVAIGTEYTLGVPPKFLSDYIISKYALLGFIKALASEYSGTGITFNVVSPGMMETKFLKEIDSRTLEINAKNIPMGRNIELKEVCGTLLYLISESASYITGTNLNLSGGNYM